MTGADVKAQLQEALRDDIETSDCEDFPRLLAALASCTVLTQAEYENLCQLASLGAAHLPVAVQVKP